MFVNRSNFVGLSPMLTKEIYNVFSDFPGLQVVSGSQLDTDAVLIGVIESENEYMSSYKNAQNLFTKSQSSLTQSIGLRVPFYYAANTTYNYIVHYYLIKRPSALEISELSGNAHPYFSLNPKVVLRESLVTSGSFDRVVKALNQTERGGEVNFTKNKGIEAKSLEDSTIQAASLFKQVVLNAF